MSRPGRRGVPETLLYRYDLSNSAPDRFLHKVFSMSHRVRVLPSRHEFSAGPHETLLEAGLQAGLALRFRCSGGTCGECRARVVEGTTQATGPSDFRLSEAEQAAGEVLMCRAAAASDLVVEAPEAGSAADIPRQEIQVKVAKLERPSDNIMIVHLRTPRSQTLRFLAGQYVTLSLEDLPPRDKSIASCPCNGMVLQVHIRHRPGDPFPEHVFDGLKISRKMTLTGPFGDFVLDEVSNRPMVFIAFEIGFASTKSLIEHAIALDLSQPMTLHWIVLEPDGHYMENYCRSWQASLDNFRYLPEVLSAGDEDVEERVTARVLELLERHGELSGLDLYLSVPAGSGPRLLAELSGRGVPAGQVHMELREKY
jgi:CDP-4-dehydro-6-deoxyglucose reductase